MVIVARKEEGSQLLHVSSSDSIHSEPAEMEKSEPWNKNVDQETTERRGITFYPGVAVRECLHINDYTPSEVYNCWYKKQDFNQMKITYSFIVQKIANGTWSGDSDTETSRGLEFRHREGAMKRKTNKLNGLMAVLDEQERQWRRGVEDDKAIADAYVAVNLKCSFAARMQGAKDEADRISAWKDKVNDDELISDKMSHVSVGNVKREHSPEGYGDGNKKTRLKMFIKKIQTAQRAANALSAPLKSPPRSRGESKKYEITA